MAPKSTTKPWKHAASSVGEGVTTKRARKAKEPTSSKDAGLVGGDQGEQQEGEEEENQGKGKPGGRGQGGKAAGKGKRKIGRYVPPYEPIIS